MIMQNFIKILLRVYLSNNAISAVRHFGLIIPPHTINGVVRDSDFVSKNELMGCIRMENGIYDRIGHGTIRMWYDGLLSTGIQHC